MLECRKFMFETIGKNLTFKVQTDSNYSFLLSLYGSTREDELSMTSMLQREKEKFISQQFEARELDYAKRFNDAKFLIIYRKKQAIGRVVYRVDESTHLIDLALVRKLRENGLGSTIISTLIEYAKENNKELHLSVAMDNTRAIKLYQRLGFKITNQHGYYYAMRYLGIRGKTCQHLN